MNFKLLLEDILEEVNKKDVLVQKLGLSERNADFIYNLCGPLSVFIANKIIGEMPEQLVRAGYVETPITKEITMDHINKGSLIQLFRQKIVSIMDWIRVGLNGNVKPYQNLTFEQLFLESEKWHDELQVGDSTIDYKEEHPVVVDFRNENGNGYYWVDLETKDCDEESKRMGHCGRSAGNLYSLRFTSPIENTKFTKNRSLITASVNDDGVLLQMKGPHNKKPSEELHPYIVPFILNDIVEKFGSEYASNEDFNLNDLTDEEIKIVYDKKPSLFEGRKARKALQRIGLVPERSKDDMWFELYLSPADISYYVDGDWTVRNWVDSRGNKQKAGMFETLLSGDYWDLFDTSGDWKIALEYHTDDENKDIIKDMLKQRTNPEDIEHMSLEKVIDEYDDDWEIRHALSNAMSSTESDATYTYFYNALRNALEEYGEVTKLNDDGTIIKINLQDIIDKAEPDENDLDDMFERCGDEIDCVFREMLGDYYDKPDFRIDDRWSPDIDEREFNNTLNSYLGDIR